jgi:hypothetical protein
MISRSSAVVFVIIQVNYVITVSNLHVLRNNDRFANSFGATYPKQLERPIAEETISG